LKDRSILGLQDLSDEEIDGLLDLARDFRERGVPRTRPDRFVVGLFFNPSLRTRLSLEAAALRLGAHCRC
jgi:aspartate carbamoyltransferase catalytic subunit